MLRQSLLLAILCGFGQAELDLGAWKTLVESGLGMSVPATTTMILKTEFTHAPQKKAFTFLTKAIIKEGIIGNATSIKPAEASVCRQFESWKLECDKNVCEFKYTKNDGKPATELAVSKIRERGMSVTYVKGTVEHHLRKSDYGIKMNVVKTEKEQPSPAFSLRISLKSLRNHSPALDNVQNWTKFWYSAPEGRIDLVTAKPMENTHKFYYFENVEPVKEMLKKAVAENCITVVNVLQSGSKDKDEQWQDMLQVQVEMKVVLDESVLLAYAIEPSKIPSLDTTEWCLFEFNRAN